MKAKESRLLDFLRGAHQFVIPIYQRHGIVPVGGWKVDLSREFKRRAHAAKNDAFEAVDLERWTLLFEEIEPQGAPSKRK